VVVPAPELLSINVAVATKIGTIEAIRKGAANECFATGRFSRIRLARSLSATPATEHAVLLFLIVIASTTSPLPCA
jgi:hypothetical protein